MSFAVGLGVHRTGFIAIESQPRPIDPGSFSDDVEAHQAMLPRAARPLHRVRQGVIIDAEYRVVS